MAEWRTEKEFSLQCHESGKKIPKRKKTLNGHDVRRGDVLIAGLGDDRNTVGWACVAPPGIEPAMVKADCFRFRLDLARALPEFIAVQLTEGSVADAGVLSSGSTRSRIPLSVMASRRLALPPLSGDGED
jgi:type I restriction enzyme, S subunit